MTRYAITHETTLEYAVPVRLAKFALRLRPADWPGHTVSDFALDFDPVPARLSEGPGAYHVCETRFSLPEPVQRLKIASRFTVMREPLSAEVLEARGPALCEVRARALALPDLSALGPAAYLFASPIAMPAREIAAWAAAFLDARMPVVDAGRALMAAIHRQFAFDAAATYPDTAPIEAFRQRHGVCQDFSHVMIVAARAHGIPAAYVSGYLRTRPPPGRPRLVGVDAMHAWVNLWCGEELGWIGFDPTNDALADTDHVLIGMGRDYADVAPLDGTFRGGGQQRMFFSVDVAPLD
jgi:transglutaminase-like putative cysteine protease